MSLLALGLLVLPACDAFLQGMHEEQARIDAERAAAQAPAAPSAASPDAPTDPPARLVSFGDPAALPDDPTRDQARAWVAAQDLCALHEDRLSAGTAPPSTGPAALAAAWNVLARAPSDDAGKRDRLLATCAFARAAALSDGDRRRFLDATALHRDPLESIPPRPLVELLRMNGALTVVDPEAALVAHLSVLEPDEIGRFLQDAGVMTLDEGEWDVDAQALAGLSDAVLAAVEARADAGSLGPRSGLGRALAQVRRAR